MNKLKPGQYWYEGFKRFTIPEGQFLLHRVKLIEKKLIEWYKKNRYNQGDDYSVIINDSGQWEVSHSNDYPLQHGAGGKVVLTHEQFMEAMGETKRNRGMKENFDRIYGGNKK